MQKEIERKFLVNIEDFNKIDFDYSYVIKQGYLTNEIDKSIRIRLKDKAALLTIKGKSTGLSKPEFEYEIPKEDAEFMLKNLTDGNLIQKTRYVKKINGKKWEVDVFDGDNLGLIIAEIELLSEDEKIQIPFWCGKEVSLDKRYINARLIKEPFNTWKENN